MNKKRAFGFTLLELVIAVAIVGIVASIAFPAYIGYMQQSRRADAQAALVSFANAMERWYTEKNTFKGAAAGGADTGAPASEVFPSQTPSSGTANYSLSITAATAATYTLAATSLTADSCSPLTLTEQGVRGPSGCW